MRHLGLKFMLNDKETLPAAFYRNLVRDNCLPAAYAVLSSLTVGGEVVATLLGIPQRFALCDGAHQQCRREMVELLARPA